MTESFADDSDRSFGVDLILPARLDQGGARVQDVAARIDPSPMPLQTVLTGFVLGRWVTDRDGRQGVSMNGAGNTVGLVHEVLPAAVVVEQMVAQAADCLRR